MQVIGDARMLDTECPHCGMDHTVWVESSEFSWFLKIELMYGGVACSPCFDDGARAFHLAQMVH